MSPCWKKTQLCRDGKEEPKSVCERGWKGDMCVGCKNFGENRVSKCAVAVSMTLLISLSITFINIIDSFAG